ncbi:MAG: methyl-accepting chemotaxis protein [Planctomycetes bacterium]|nr:methyl-accepting chemotaxis protein [Planctomycetota bacterium]
MYLHLLPLAVRLALAFALVLGVGAWGSFSTRADLDEIRANTIAKLQNDTVPGLESMGGIAESLALIRGDFWRFMATRDAHVRADQLQDIKRLRAELDKELAAYQTTISREEDRRLFGELNAHIADWLRGLEPLLAADRNLDPADLDRRVKAATGTFSQHIRPLLDRLLKLNRTWLDEALHENLAIGEEARQHALLIPLLSLGLGLAVAILLTWSIVRPLGWCRRSVLHLAQGRVDECLDAGQKAALARRRDEIGAIAQAVAGMQGYLAEVSSAAGRIAKGDLAVQVAPRSADDRLGLAFGEMVAQLRKDIGLLRASSEQLAGAAEELTSLSNQLSSSAEETAAQSTQASAAGEQVHGNVQTVATGAEEMTASITAISASAHTMSQQVGEAAGSAAKLSEAALSVDKIIQSITTIAQRTNLLALNAAIEAASAGEAGRGFAVVAGEVKVLAAQSQAAAEQASSILGQMKTHAAAVGSSTAQAKDSVLSVAGAVEQQSSTTGEIGRSMGEAAKATAEIAGSLGQVAKAAEETTQAAVQLKDSAGTMARMAGELSQVVKRFTV